MHYTINDESTVHGQLISQPLISASQPLVPASHIASAIFFILIINFYYIRTLATTDHCHTILSLPQCSHYMMMSEWE